MPDELWRARTATRNRKRVPGITVAVWSSSSQRWPNVSNSPASGLRGEGM